MNHPHDTIAAFATATGQGGIAILRISGPDAPQILGRIFTRPTANNHPLRPRYMHFGHALDMHGEKIDDVLAVFMPGPHSATGEDVGEIHCHAGQGVTTALLEAAFAAGARMATPGEFTRRAFLNGRMDLTQAEAVAEIVSAPTPQGARLARAKLEGALSHTIARIAKHIESCRVQVTLAIDFPDEDAELLSPPQFSLAIAQARQEIQVLLTAFERARLWREGVCIVLSGRVNAGKSSLLNALVGRQRAIVSPLPGTTRDYIEEMLYLNGLAIRLIDTAGLRSTGDVIEEEGMRLSHELAAEADLLLLVLDAHEGLYREEEEFLTRYSAHRQRGRIVVVLNKIDAAPTTTLPASLAQCPVFAVSALSGAGLDDLTAGIYSLLTKQAAAAPSFHESQGAMSDIAPNLRQSQLLRQAEEELAFLADDLGSGMPPDILGVRLDTVVMLLNEVTGATDNEAILDVIFSSFCIGK